MTIFLILLAGLAIWAVAATVLSVVRDGYRRVPTRAGLPSRSRESQPNYR